MNHELLTGVPQMGHLLLGLAEAGVKLKKLRYGIASWRIFACESTQAKMRMALPFLKTLNLTFTTALPTNPMTLKSPSNAETTWRQALSSPSSRPRLSFDLSA